jgi:Ca2+-binding RTX toxin-like protein
MITKTNTLIATTVFAVSLIVCATFVFAASALTENFESYTLGTINGQGAWTSSGAAGSGCAVYDHKVSSSYGVPGFGTQSLRISNAVTSGCFGDMTFAAPLADAAGEIDSTDGVYSRGTLQNHFEAEFEIRAMQLSQQSGLFLSVSPDRGDGSRMSYLGFEDTADGIDVIFYDVQSTGSPANFVGTTVADNLSRAVTHKAKFVMDFVDGPSNDVVKIYIDDVLVHTGTTWENYYRYDVEASAEQSPRITKTLIFRTGGAAAPATLGLGYLIDNLSLSTSIIAAVPDVTVSIVKYIDGTHANATSANSLPFPMGASWAATNIGAGSGSFTLSTTGFNNPNPYEATTADMTSGASYSLAEDLSGSNVGASCAEGKPFALVGYTVGDSELDAAGATPTTTPPTLTAITTDKYIIVWNTKCVTSLTLQKTVINDEGGTELDTAWTLSASGPTPLSGIEGNASVTNAPVIAGTYNLSETGPAGYAASAWVCTGGNQTDSDTVEIASGESVTCVITNDDIAAPPVVPPPPANACATPGSAPVGYTLQTGTNGNDTVTIAPFTMFVGLNGTDIVNGPAVGNYIVCTGNGNDTITLGNGGFTISAGNGNNVITVGNGDGYLSTSNGNDRITTGDGVQTIIGGSGNNVIQTGNGNKTVTTGPAIDRITTGSGNDVINAGGGINTIQSGSGNDTVTTGTASDTIDGGPGTDTCNAGSGAPNSLTGCEA